MTGIKQRGVWLLILALLWLAILPAQAQTISGACLRFKPGHYVSVLDDKWRNQDGIAGIKSVLSKDVRNFTGVVYIAPWGMIETSKGVYDFTRLDAALATTRASGKVLMLLFMDRTFHLGCNSPWLPAYVARDTSYNTAAPNACYARMWEQETMDHEIRVLKAVATRYKNDRAFIGISIPETSVAAMAMQGHPEIRAMLYPQLKRLYLALRTAAPTMVVHQMMNWADEPSLRGLATTLDAFPSGGGAMGWPDSVPANAADPRWYWYQMGRDYNTKLLVMPHAQTMFIGGTLADTEAVYRFLSDNIGAHAVVWSTWHKDVPNYFTASVIPTVNKFGGALKNKLCPW